MLSEPEKIRVLFQKTGPLKFISHLDLDRTMKAAFLRARLPIKYTEGFNPHPKLVFSLPLSVGTASLCEFMDFRITEEIPKEELRDRLNAAFPPDLRAIDVYTPETKFCEIGFASYDIVIRAPEADENTVSAIRAAFDAPMNVEKTGKGGTRTLDIAPLCRLLSCEKTEDGIALSLRLSSSETEFVNPRLPLDFLAAHIAVLPDDGDYTVCRTAVYRADGVTEFR